MKKNRRIRIITIGYPKISTPDNQTGVALLTALLMTALIAVLAINVAWQTSLDLRRTENLINSDRAMLYAMGAEAWAAEVLRIDSRDSSDDHLGEDWATPVPLLPIEQGAIQGYVEDMQGRFNLNNLVAEDGTIDPLVLAQFERLLGVLELDTGIAQIVADWIDSNNEPEFPNGAEDGLYTGMVPPYRTANTALTSTSELLALTRIDAQTWATLAPYVTALPRGTRINVNTASNPVLRSLGENISDTDAENLIGERGDQGFEDLSPFDELVTADIMENIDLSSRFFRVTADVSIGSTRFTMYSLLERNDGQPVPLLRTFNSE